MREIGISPCFSRDKFVLLQTKQRYSTRDISGEVFLTLFFRGFVPFLSLADFVSRDKNLQVADLQRLKLYFGGLVTATTSNHQDSTTHGTLTRKKEMDKRKEPGFNYVFHRIVLKKRQQSNTLHRLVCYNGKTSPASFKNNGCSSPLVAMI